MFQQFFRTVQPSNSNSSVGEEVVNPYMNISEKLQNIMDKSKGAEKCSNTEGNKHFAEELVIFE